MSNKPFVDVVVGLQYGDEGKGKVVDTLSPLYDLVARFNGGPNAGHTIYRGDEKFVLHSIPSGILHKGDCYIGNGCVVSVDGLDEEVTSLESKGVSVRGRLFLSEDAHVITEECLKDETNGVTNSKIGTTGKGIGPTYARKAYRNGTKVKDVLDSINTSITVVPSMFIYEYENRKLLAEGAQGYALDLDFGDYPYVTSSNTISGAVCTGLGVPPKAVNNVLGVCKAYETKVGGGKLPYPYDEEKTKEIREKGKEYGATTGRPRDIGMLNLDLLKQAIKVNGVNAITLMKSDVLRGFIPSYVFNGKVRSVGTPVSDNLFEDPYIRTIKKYIHDFGVRSVFLSNGPSNTDWVTNPADYWW